MASVKEEKGSEFFSRYEKGVSSFLLQKDILPPLSSRDVVQISGGPGTGKTELLYHFILRCILPESHWNGRDLRGLDLKVILIDNDCRFNLFRLIQIFEKYLEPPNRSVTSVSKETTSSFIDSRLELLEISKCSSYDEFVCSLRSLEFVRSQKYILMIDGVTSFHWSNKMRNLYSQAKLMEHHSAIVSAVGTISKNGVPIIVTKRKLTLSPNFDCSRLDALWRKTSTFFLELAYTCSAENSTGVTVHNITANRRILCTITNLGLNFHP